MKNNCSKAEGMMPHCFVRPIGSNELGYAGFPHVPLDCLEGGEGFSDANFLEMSKLDLGKSLEMDRLVSYEDLMNVIVSKNQQKIRSLVHSIDWLVDGNRLPLLKEDLDNKKLTAYAETVELIKQPELVELLSESGFQSLIGLQEQIYIPFMENQIKPYFDDKRIVVSPNIRLLVNRFIDDFTKKQESSFFKLKLTSSVACHTLANFLQDHGIKSKIMKTQGKVGSSIFDESIQAAVSLDGIIIDLSKGESTDRSDVFVQQDDYLRRWKWMLSDDPIISNSEDLSMP